MGGAREHLGNLGYSMEDAKGFINANMGNPSDIFKICEQYDVTTDMLEEIMEGAYSLADIQGYMEYNGFDIDLLDLSSEDYLLQQGFNIQEIHDQLMAQISSPTEFMALSKEYGLTMDMLDDIFEEFDFEDISEYLSQNDIDDDFDSLFDSEYLSLDDLDDVLNIIPTGTVPANTGTTVI